MSNPTHSRERYAVVVSYGQRRGRSQHRRQHPTHHQGDGGGDEAEYIVLDCDDLQHLSQVVPGVPSAPILVTVQVGELRRPPMVNRGIQVPRRPRSICSLVHDLQLLGLGNGVLLAIDGEEGSVPALLDGVVAELKGYGYLTGWLPAHRIRTRTSRRPAAELTC